MLIASLERLRALPRLVEITRTLVRHGLHDLVHSVGVHKLLDQAFGRSSARRASWPAGSASHR